MIPVQGYDGKTVAVLGLGRSGKAADADAFERLSDFVNFYAGENRAHLLRFGSPQNGNCHVAGVMFSGNE